MPLPNDSISRVARVTVGDIRRWLGAFEDDATVVVPCGIGYEEPKIGTIKVRRVAVSQRYLADRDGDVVVVLRPVHG